MSGKFTGPLSLMERFRVRYLGARIYLEHRTRPGWAPRGLPFYVIRCKIHGLVENRITGLADDIPCPLCQDERDEELESLLI